MFTFTTTERADLHAAVMHVFGEANERLQTALTLDELIAGLRESGWFLPLTEAELDGTLSALRGWGLIDRSQNHGAHYASAEEFERKNLQYSLTRKGEAAYEGVQHAIAALSATGALQTAVLDAIGDRLSELAGLLERSDSDDRRVFTALLRNDLRLAAAPLFQIATNLLISKSWPLTHGSRGPRPGHPQEPDGVTSAP